MADQKTLLNTRLSLRIDTWAKWQDESVEGQGANLKLNAGEVAFVQVGSVPPIPNGDSSYSTVDTVLFKVGDGTKTFKQLPWGSALAADVYGWAKKTDVEFCKWLSGDNALTEAVTFVTNASFESAISDLEAADTRFDSRISALESLAGVGDGATGGLATVTYVDGKFDDEAKARADADAALLGETDEDGKAVAGNTILSAKADAAAAATLAAQAKTIADTKVTAVEGKGLSEADFTNDEKTKLAGIAAGANKTIVDAALDKDSTNPVENKAVKAAIDAVSVVADGAKSKADNNANDILALQGLVGSEETDGLVKDVAELKVASATHATEESVAARLAEKVAVTDFNTAKAALEAEDLRLASLIGSTDAKIEAFLNGEEIKESAIDTLVEIQNYIDAHEDAAALLDGRITTNATNIGTLNTQVESLGQNLEQEKTDRDTAITNAINALDVDNLAVGAGETIKNISEVDGKISVEKQTISITKSQVSDFNDGDYASSTEFNQLKTDAITQNVELIINCGTSTTVLF